MKKLLLLVWCVFTLTLVGAQNKLTVKVDSRFEAVSLFYFLATADTLAVDDRPTPSVYYADAKRHFGPWLQHPSLSWYRQLSHWDGFDIASLGLFLSATVPYSVVKTPPRPFIRSTDPAEFLEKLNTFTQDAHTTEFVAAHRRLYKRVCRSARRDIHQSQVLDATQQFFGSRQLLETVVFVDLLNNLGNNAIPLADGRCYIRLAYLADTAQQLTDASPVRFAPLVNVVAHEAAHVYLASFIQANQARLYPLRHLFLETANSRKLDEDQWKNELDELLVRACVAHILAQQAGQARGQEEITQQARRYKLAPELYVLLGQYTANRQKYTSFEDFYPGIIAFLERKTR